MMASVGESFGDTGEVIAFRDYSARIGNDPTLVQGGGGNTSVKLGDTLWVKASGMRLSDATAQDIFVPVDLRELRKAVRAPRRDDSEIDLRPYTRPAAARPSLETPFHAFLARRFVIHVHSVNAIAHAVCRDGAERIGRLLDGLAWAWVPYARPGGRLCESIEQHAGEDTPVIVLANHGLIVQADELAEADALLAEVERRLFLAPRPAPNPDLDRLRRVGAVTGMAPARAWEAHRPAWETPDARRARRGPLYPDHVAYLGRSPIPLVHPDSAVGHVLDWRRRVDRLPDFLLLGNAGALVSPDAGDSVEPMLECLGMVSARLDPQVDLAYLTAADEDALLDWDPEIHRVETARNRR